MYGATRIGELASRVAHRADVTGLALFAGWRNQPLPDDAAGRAYFLMHVLHVLRELRRSVHLLAVVATGLGPRAAVFASGGADIANQRGWAGPYDDIAGVTTNAAEDLTDEILTRLCGAVLSADEVAVLAGLVGSMRTHFDAYVAADG